MLEQVKQNNIATTNEFEKAVATFQNDIIVYNKMRELAQQMSSAARSDFNCLARNSFDIFDNNRSTAFTEELNRSYWQDILASSKMDQLLDSEAKEELRKQIANSAPDFTLQNIKATLGDMFGDAYRIFAKGLVNVLCKLDSSYKTNDKFRITDKLIINSALTGSSYSYAKQDYIKDLERCFNIIEGRPAITPEDKTILHQIKLQKGGWLHTQSAGTAEARHFTAKYYKNGNVHLKCHNPETVLQANKIISDYFNGKALA